jgi:SAM-dependent methyltransferase
MTETMPETIRPRENVYGSLRRLEWIERHLRPADRVLEVGCGTGVMLTLPLCERGVDITGLDLDPRSIAYGRDIAARHGLDPDVLQAVDLRDQPGAWDVIILSEVLEHQTDEGVKDLLGLIHAHLAPNGRILVTVPNGRGWFELESWLWLRLGLGRVIVALRLDAIGWSLKGRLVGPCADTPYLSTLDSSPHLQHFSLGSIQATVTRAGFSVLDSTGSAVFAGPFSNLLFTGIEIAMRLNNRLAKRFPAIASGFFVAAERR